jgi:hypothetical protein
MLLSIKLLLSRQEKSSKMANLRQSLVNKDNAWWKRFSRMDIACVLMLCDLVEQIVQLGQMGGGVQLKSTCIEKTEKENGCAKVKEEI